MLLEMDHPSLRENGGAGLTAGEGALVAGSDLREADRTAPDPRSSLRSVLTQPVKWLIGVPFRPSGTRVIWMYYVVDGAHDVADAVREAMERANSARERRARGGMPVTAEHIEVRRILRDALGCTSLDGRR